MSDVLLNQTLRKFANKNWVNGVFTEPRVYFGNLRFLTNGPIVVVSDRGAFRNNERFPVRITHALISRNAPSQGATESTSGIIANYALHLILNNNDYQVRRAIPIPCWQNVPSTPPEGAESSGTWWFPQPFILCARDTMRVEAQLVTATSQGTARQYDVTFDGVGTMSQRPYRLASVIKLSTTGVEIMNPDDFRNDGVEPISIYAMSHSISSEDFTATAAASLNEVRIQIQQIGNGTNAPWIQGPVDPFYTRCPANLVCPTTIADTVVHEFPTTDEGAPGVLLEPGEGFSVGIRKLYPTNEPNKDETLLVSLCGYIIGT